VSYNNQMENILIMQSYKVERNSAQVGLMSTNSIMTCFNNTVASTVSIMIC